MECDQCGHEIQLRKSLNRGKSRYPGECPECESKLEKANEPDGDLIRK